MEKIRILNTPCIPFQSHEHAKAILCKIVEGRIGGYSVAINAEKIMLYNQSDAVKDLIDNALLQTPDGAGAVLAMKWLHKRRTIKLDLPKLVLEIVNDHKLRLFVLGAVEEVNQLACERILGKYTNIQLVGRRNGYFDDVEAVAAEIAGKSANIVLVALGSPRQEFVSRTLSSIIPDTIFIGCGGALDIFAGRITRAPRFFIDNNLEWFYRLALQPSRIRRQKVLPIFLMKLIGAVIANQSRKS